MKRPFIYLLIYLFSTISISLCDAQKAKWKYDTDEIKAHFWSPNNKVANDNVVPEKWADKSAVILYSDYELEIEKERSNDIAYISLLTQNRIKIQDEAALEDYSELRYAPNSLYTKDADKTAWGIKIVKANGKEEVLDVDKEKVEVKNNNETNYKIAIPNLEVGDIIDVYKFSYYKLYSYTNNTLWIDKSLLQGRYPIKHTAFKINTCPMSKIFFRPVNGAPELEIEKLGDNYCFYFEAKDLEEIKASNWHFPFQDNPYYKLKIQWGHYFIKDREKENKEIYISEKTERSIKNSFSDTYRPDSKAKNEYGEFKRFIKGKGITLNSDAEKLEHYFYFLRHKFLNMHLIYKKYHFDAGENEYTNQIIDHMVLAINSLELDYEVLLVHPRQRGKIKDIMDMKELYQVIKVKTESGNVYFYNTDQYTVFNILPMTVEGSEAYTLHSPGKGRDINLKKVTLPSSSHEENVTNHIVTVDFPNGIDQPALIKTEMEVIGRGMYSYKEDILNVFDYVLEENEYYDTKRWGATEIIRDKKMLAKVKQMKTEEEKRIEEVFTAYANQDFEEEEVTYKDSEVISNGNWHFAKDLKFSYTAEVDGLVKKVGPNYLFNAGKLVGGQIEIDDKEKERTENIYMRYGRAFDYKITVNLPAGYSVDGLDKFKNNVENATGGLVSNASSSGNTISINYNKHYKNNFEPVENWPQMIEFLDAGFQFTQEKLLLKK